jgi:hypothetical protein
LDVDVGDRRHLNISEVLSGEYAAIHLFSGIPDDVKNPSTDTALLFLELTRNEVVPPLRDVVEAMGVLSGSSLSQV